MNRPPAFLLGPIHMGKWGDKSISLERFGALCHRHSHCGEICSWRGPRSRSQLDGMAPPPCLSGPPHVGPGPGLWGQRTRACLCCVLSLGRPASAPHPPWRAWRLSQGLREGVCPRPLSAPQSSQRGAQSTAPEPASCQVLSEAPRGEC